jgi:hypothetical protein
MVRIKRCVRKLVETAIKPKHLARSFHSAHRGRGHAGVTKFGKAHDPLLLKHSLCDLAL